jgi:ubiquinone/menaquinone biosynthesis C-methylase UbiE
MISDSQRWDIIHQRNHKPDELHSQYAEVVEKSFPRGSLIVELGAGTGADAMFFLRQGHSIIALDISAFALKTLADKVNKENFSKRLITKQVDFGLHAIPVKNDSIDIAYSRISLNYFDAPHTTKIFSDIYRVLKVGGKAFLTFKSPDDTLEMEYLTKSSTVYEPNVFIEGGMLRSRFSEDQLKEILTKAQIEEFAVRPFKEDLGRKGGGHHPSLYVNEVTFTKS